MIPPRSHGKAIPFHRIDDEEESRVTYEDILFEVKDGVATITINRPEVYNAFRAQTCEELIDAFNRAGWDKTVGVIVLYTIG